jgi:hypothetical protein
MTTYKDLIDLAVNGSIINLLEPSTYIGEVNGYSFYIKAESDTLYKISVVNKKFSLMVREYNFINDNCIIRKMVSFNKYSLETHSINDDIQLDENSKAIDSMFIKFLEMAIRVKEYVIIDSFDKFIDPFIVINDMEYLQVPYVQANDKTQLRIYRNSRPDDMEYMFREYDPFNPDATQYSILKLNIINHEAIITDLYGDYKQYTLSVDDPFIKYQNDILIPYHDNSKVTNEFLKHHNECFNRACNFITLMTFRRYLGMFTNERYTDWAYNFKNTDSTSNNIFKILDIINS